MKTNRIMKALLITLSIIVASMSVPGTAEAASKKAVKSVSLKIGAQQVAKKTYILQKGKKASLKATVNPSKAKKSVAYKSSNKKIAAVSKSGKITAKKAGTAKITVTVKGKNGKKKSTWVKVKVTTTKKSSANPQTSSVNGHKHKWVNITETKRVYVVDSQAWDEPKFGWRTICFGCGADITGNIMHASTCGDNGSSYSSEYVQISTIHHEEKGHYENRTEVLDRKCSICGILDSQL